MFKEPKFKNLDSILGNISGVDRTIITVNGVDYIVKSFFYLGFDGKPGIEFAVTDKFVDGNILFKCDNAETLDKWFEDLKVSQ